MILPGEIYMADLDVAGAHPVLVISREELNRGRTVVAVLITSANFAVRSKLANCVPFKAGQFGLTKDCVAQCEFMLAVDVGQLDLDGGPIGRLDDATMRDVIRAERLCHGSRLRTELDDLAASGLMNNAEHAVVVLTRDLPQHGLRTGDVGAVVHVYRGGAAYEVEFITRAGQTLSVETLAPADIRPLVLCHG